tara:strand:+ start:2845 stop:3546 length:702 start_codon:yes stop_codon:yes gene_type:complete
MNEKLFKMPLYVNDFIASTMVMSAAERGAYISLLCHAWIDDGLTSDKAKLARLAGCDRIDLKVALERFYLDESGRYRHKRMEEVREEVMEKRNKLTKAGKKGAEARWKPQCDGISDRKANRNAIAMPVKVKVKDSITTNTTTTLSVPERIGLENNLKLIAEEINAILRQQGKDATGAVVSWGKPDDRLTLKMLRAREREINHKLLGFNPRQREEPVSEGMKELASGIAEEMRL